ncbi:MAG: DUF6412 domain-containing protein [Cellulosimicrobium cellulans]
MNDLLVVARDVASALALLLGTSTLTATLFLLGATALVAAVAAASARWGAPLVLGVAARPAGRRRDAVAGGPVVAQSDPDAPGRARPRAPGRPLG